MSSTLVKTTRVMAIAALIVGSVLAPHMARAEQVAMAGIKRTDLQRHDLGVPGREAVQVRVDIDPGVAFGKHTHPGEEIIYVLEGSLEYQIEGKPPMTLKAGDVLFIPERSMRRRTSAAAPRVSSPPMSSKKASRFSHW